MQIHEFGGEVSTKFYQNQTLNMLRTVTKNLKSTAKRFLSTTTTTTASSFKFPHNLTELEFGFNDLGGKRI